MQIDNEFVGNLQKELKVQKATDVVREALTILNWAVQERKKNRTILSANTQGKEVVRLAMPSLDLIKLAG